MAEPNRSVQALAEERRAWTVSTWPKITLVTAVHNGEKYLEATIRSVLGQGYPNLEYFIVDGASTDGTVEVIRKYEGHIAGWISEPDNGMYDAINKGFAQTSGEIMGWLNSSDQLHTGGLFVVGSVFETFPELEWITGRPTGFSPEGLTIKVGNIPRWSRYRFLAGANRKYAGCGTARRSTACTGCRVPIGRR